MTHVSSTSSNTNIGLTHTGGLTPDGLVLYLQTQLEDIDGRIDTFMAKQKQIQAWRKELNAIATALNSVKVPEKDATSAMDKPERAAFIEARTNLEELEFDEELTKSLHADIKELTAEDLKSLQTGVENAIKELESSASLDMIQLQSCVSQRNSCISLATNLMSAVGKGEESIAGNIGR